MSTRPTRRAVLATGLAATASPLLSGCAMGGVGGGGRAPEIDGKADDKGGKVSGKITVWSWDVAAKAMKRLAGDFEQRHPGTTVDVVDIGYDNAYDKITIGLRGGTGLADVLTVEGTHMPRYIANFPAGFYDLMSLGGRYGGDFERAAWHTVTGPGGKLFALPWDIGPCALYYRTDHFRAAGVDPRSLLTWDDYVKAGIRIKKATGHKLIIQDPADKDAGIFPMLLQQQGQHYFKGGRVAVDTPAAVKALTLMKALGDEGLVAYERGWDGLVTGTKEGKAATTPTAAWWTGTLTSEMPELKGRFGVVPLPGFTADSIRTSNVGGSTLAVPAQSKNPRLAWAFIEFLLTRKDNQISMLKREGLFPAYLPALDDPHLSERQDYFDGQRTLDVFARLARNIPPVEYDKDDAKAADIMISAVTGVMLHGRDPRRALGSAAGQLARATGRKRAE
ncbi:sugar ABC transporter substrate-binding protein (plasmid) [Streptomyces sp. 4503]|uniref:Sugar ABC transporter substrate-binding protein n=1 Tax=Streptomyces niphimycinicus TaxID=2842201 RepID=A0ABS6C6W1_9ACTN|nr:sugar ABC transporter substrate-binding protein [Streptomyces niphimycinicus]MBU3862589.1 sugar ABC transporter substrate-binding protein [Streptomyces niphimycinicus]